MQRTLRIDPADAVPLWRQIEEGVRRLVASGALPPGRPVPSVREMAADLRINPATVVKAYQRLTEAGILSVRRGEGTFVADAPPATSPGERRQELEGGALRYASLAVTLGAAEAEATEHLRRALVRLRRTGSGGLS